MRDLKAERRSEWRLIGSMLVLAAALALLPAPAKAIGEPNPGPQDNCALVCSSSSCDTGCKKLGVWTTCAEFNGHPANDYDSDGVVNSSDNCICTANTNQANCDGDALGNACDSVDNSWYLFQVNTQTCYVDVDDHVLWDTMEFYRKDVYKSTCTGQTCVKNRLKKSFNCYPSADEDCCYDHGGTILDCGLAWNYDSCGTPKCSF